jgi:hypothetical protein
MTKGTLKERLDTYYESCYYIFKGEPQLWKDGAVIKIWIDQVTDADVYMFLGNNRSNAAQLTSSFDNTLGLSYYQAGISDTLIMVS